MKRFLLPTAVFFCLTGILSLSVSGQILLNELDVNPGGVDDGCEYIELIGPPGASTTDYYFVSLEGDAASNEGSATLVIQFGDSNNPGPALGSNGLLVVKSAVGCGSRTYGEGTGTTVISTAGLNSGVLQNGSNSFLLIFSPTNPITTGTTATDYDTNDDGVLELPAGAVIVDGVAWRDSGATDIVYGNAVLTAAGASDSNPIGAATRLPGKRMPNSAAAWYAGNRVGAPSDVTYSATVRTANFPPNGALTPGTPNIGPRDAPADMNGDGTTDYVIIRQGAAADTEGAATPLAWWIYAGNGLILPTFNWGVTGDIPLVGDFDGDGRDDHAVFRPSNATFYIINSFTSTIRVEQFGQSGDIPVVEDYTGDGADDLAVYRQGAWYYKTAGFYSVVNWGAVGDTPAPGDYNGDGKADFAIRRPSGSEGVFWIFADGAITVQTHGAAADRVVPGDYDADGRTDIAVAADSGGSYQWSWRPSGSPGTVLSEVWGVISTDLLAQGDYDGDGRTDLAIYRTTDGRFWVFSVPTRRFIIQSWGGQPGDKPLINYSSN